MKTILVPTDFSEIADNAGKYAVLLAQQAKAKVILFHVFHLPIPVNEMPTVVITADELEKINLEQLEDIKKKLITPGIEIECIARTGFAGDEIVEFSKEKKVDLVVMGIKGTSLINEILIGSITTEVIRKTHQPVLVIPEKSNFQNIEKIAFACDYSEISDSSILKPLEDMVRLFKSKLLVVNVMQPEEVTTVEKAVAGIKLEHYLETIDHNLYFPTNDDVIEGINDFVYSMKAGMIAMIQRKHSIFQRILNKSNTKNMVFHTHIPLLVLPDKQAEKEEEKLR